MVSQYIYRYKLILFLVLAPAVMVIVGYHLNGYPLKSLLGAGSVQAQGQNRTVLAFYYSWYDPSSFGPGRTPYQPIEPYSSSDTAVIQRQVNQARSAGIDGFVQSWYGPSANQTESNLWTLLDISASNGFKVAVDFESGSPFFNNHSERITALSTLLTKHVNHPSYLRNDGKPVVFFWANWLFPVNDWAEIRNQVDPNHQSIWIAEGGRSEYLSVFDGLHLYNIAWSNSPAITAASWASNTRAAAQTYGAYKYWVGTAMPGFNDSLLGRGEATVVRDRAGGNFFQNSFAGAAASNPDMIIINSFNEWAEGSHIEPSLEFGNFYLDLASQLSAGFKAGSVPVSVAQIEPTAGPSLTPIPTSTIGPSPTPTSSPPPTGSPTTVPSPTAGPDGKYVYQVQPGDTLTWIADRFGVSLQELYELNNLESTSVLIVNQAIILGFAEPSSALTMDEKFPGTVTRVDGSIVYTVVEGDTLLGISGRYNLDLEDLFDLNEGLDQDSVLLLGEKLIVGRKPVPQETGGSTQLPTLEPTFTRTAVPTAPPTETFSPTEVAAPTLVAEMAPATEATTSTASSSSDQLPDGLIILFIGLILLLASIGVFFLYLGRRSN